MHRLSALLVLVACAPPESPTGPSSGYYEVSFDLPESDMASGDVRSATLGGIAVLELSTSEDELVGLVQGSPTPGSVDLVLTDADGATATIAAAFSYDEPAHPAYDRVVAIGASLTQGVQGGVPNYRGSLHSPPAYVARATGGYLPLPLLIPGLFAAVTPADIGPAPECVVPDIRDFASGGASDVMSELWDPVTETFRFAGLRLDPELMPSNLAVGGSNIRDVLDGLPDEDFGRNFVAHLVHDPWGELGAPALGSQLRFLEEAAPTLVITTDLFGNDVIGAIVNSDVIDPSAIPPTEEFEADLRELLERVEATGADFFVPTLPRPTLLPATEEKKRRMIADGLVTPEEADALIAAVEQAAIDYNATLVAVAADHPGVVVVPLADEVAQLEIDGGLDAGGEQLTISKFGGILGPDGIHFSDTGYALLANLLLDAMDERYGTELPRVDLATVLADDPAAPAAYLAAGLDPEDCE